MSTQWERMLKEIVSEYKNSPDKFLRKRMISRTVHPNQQKLAKKYYNEMLKDTYFKNNVLPNLRDGDVGNPYKFDLLPVCSPTTIIHIHYLYVIQKEMGIFIPKDEITHIVEIGGGYGNLCRLAKSIGYDGKYIIVDFPEMSTIQRDYLKQNSIEDVSFSELNMEELIPTEGADKSMLIATFSVNEMPLETRRAMEPYYKYYDYLFFAYNPKWNEIDNIEYFNGLELALAKDFEIKHIKDKFRRTRYMLCKRRKT